MTMSMPLFAPERQLLLMIMDGHAMVHRSFRAISTQRNLTSSATGEDTTGVYGFTNVFLRALQELESGLLRHCVRHLGTHFPAPAVRGLQGPARTHAA